MADFRADLHMHSTCSDGTDSPRELVAKAIAAGLSAISITDHDTCAAYAEDLRGIELVTGIELSCELRNVPIHMLGYCFDVAKMAPFIEEIQARRLERNRAILAKLAKCSIAISEEELGATTALQSIGRPHIAAILVKRGLVSSIREAFDVYLREGGKCFAPGFRYTPAEIVDQIHSCGGKAILAHPHFIKKGAVVKELFKLPIQGIECYYGNLPDNQVRPWLAIARERKWLMTGGSDYHGAIKPHISLGASWVGEADFNALRAP